MNESRRRGARPAAARAFLDGITPTLTMLLMLVIGSSALAGQSPLFRAITAPSFDGDEVRLQLDLALLQQGPEILRFDLPSYEQPVFVSRTHFERRAQGLVWRGAFSDSSAELALTGLEDVVLTLHEDLVIGRIYTKDGVLVIRPDARGTTHLLSPLEGPLPRSATGDDATASAPAPCGGAVEVDRPVAPPLARQRLGSVGGEMGTPRLDVMIAYTSRARAELGASRVQAEARAAVDYLNLSLSNSGVSGSGRLVQTVEAAQMDSYRSQDDALPALRLDPLVTTQRAAAGADVVVLFMASADASDACGLGYVLSRGDTPTSMSPFAFSTVNVGCDIGSTTAHEIGHNLGLHHDPQNASSTRKYAPDAHGHFFGQGANFKTVMSYGPFADIPYYSTPDREHNARPVGILDERNNTRVLGETLRMGSRYSDNGGPPAPGGDPTIAPSNLTVTDIGPTFVSLQWVDNAEEEIVVLVEQRPAGSGWQQVQELDPDTTSTTVDGLTRNLSYDFRVRVRTQDDVSTYSNRVSATTLAGPGRPELLEITPSNSTSVVVTYTGVALGDTVRVESRTLDASPDEYTVAAEVPEDGNGSLLVTGLIPDRPYTFRLIGLSGGQASEPSQSLSVTPSARTGDCVADDETLCLQSGRFELKAHWNDSFNPPNSGPAGVTPVPASEETGFFYFFDPANVEVVSKVLDGRAFNDHFWKFYGALSNVEYWITVRDTLTDVTRTYHNPPFDLCGSSDIEAFDDSPPIGQTARQSLPVLSPAAVSAGTGTCASSDDHVCLGDGRFQVSVTWEAPDGSNGVGRPVPGTATNDSGFFWFFSETNLELAVKILDGQAINGNFWFYWGGLSDVGYEITVLDTVTGATATYQSTPGDVCGGADVNAL